MNPYFSIIMPAYNSAAFIEETLRSIAAQTFSDFEVLIIDDGSSDLTCQIVEAKSWQDPRFRLIKSSHQGKPSILRNLAAKEAKGKYLAFCDSDDLFSSHALQRKHDFLSYCPEAVLVFSDYVYFRERNGQWQEDARSYFEGIASFFKYLDSSYIQSQQEQLMTFRHNFWQLLSVKLIVHTSTVAMSREVFQRLGGFDEKRLYGEDWDLWLRTVKEGVSGAISEVHCLKREREESLTAKTRAHFLDAVEQQSGFLKKEKLPRQIRSLIRREIARKAYSLGMGFFRDFQMPESRRWLGRSILSGFRPFSAALYFTMSFVNHEWLFNLKKRKSRRKS